MPKFVANNQSFKVRVAPDLKIELGEKPVEVGTHKYTVNGIEKTVDVASRLRECYGKYVTEVAGNEAVKPAEKPKKGDR